MALTWRMAAGWVAIGVLGTTAGCERPQYPMSVAVARAADRWDVRDIPVSEVEVRLPRRGRFEWDGYAGGFTVEFSPAQLRDDVRASVFAEAKRINPRGAADAVEGVLNRYSTDAQGSIGEIQDLHRRVQDGVVRCRDDHEVAVHALSRHLETHFPDARWFRVDGAFVSASPTERGELGVCVYDGAEGTFCAGIVVGAKAIDFGDRATVSACAAAFVKALRAAQAARSP